MITDPKKRFSNRVAYYIKYRPTYPPAVIDYLRQEINFSPTWVIADVGSGTGILAEIFLQRDNLVFGVEPNQAMRLAAEDLLLAYPNFRSIDGSAEATALAAGSIDLVTAGQAFHWFDPAQAKVEFSRILKPGGRVVLVWNTRRVDATPLMRAYEQLLDTYAEDYRRVKHTRVDRNILGTFFNGYRAKAFGNSQYVDYETLKGRLLSSSYAPMTGHPQHAPMITALCQIFDQYQVDGRVRFEYDTNLFYGYV